jgi:hypothetical protein
VLARAAPAFLARRVTSWKVQAPPAHREVTLLQAAAPEWGPKAAPRGRAATMGLIAGARHGGGGADWDRGARPPRLPLAPPPRLARRTSQVEADSRRLPLRRRGHIPQPQRRPDSAGRHKLRQRRAVDALPHAQPLGPREARGRRAGDCERADAARACAEAARGRRVACARGGQGDAELGGAAARGGGDLELRACEGGGGAALRTRCGRGGRARSGREREWRSRAAAGAQDRPKRLRARRPRTACAPRPRARCRCSRPRARCLASACPRRARHSRRCAAQTGPRARCPRCPPAGSAPTAASRAASRAAARARRGRRARAPRAGGPPLGAGGALPGAIAASREPPGGR